MTGSKYWEYKFTDSPEFANTWDELPLWSASFGLLILKQLRLEKNITILDIGSGAGFPLLEIAERSGSTCRCIGLDTWKNVNDRVRLKIKNYNIKNVKVIDGSAEQIPLHDASVDLIVSNLGINNFIDTHKVIQECERVLKDNGRVAMTTNLNGHFAEFYEVFRQTLIQLKLNDVLPELQNQEQHRGTLNSFAALFEEGNFKITKRIEESYQMHFTDGTAFLNHHFIRLGWMSSWTALINENDHERIFTLLEQNLNIAAEINGGLNLTVPMAYVEAVKISIL